MHKYISIIIPVYNVEKFIGKCLDSCIKQDLPLDNYEIIVVNDGSPDNSVSVVSDYQQQFTNIRIVNRKNGGLSAARNTGLEIATGDYVWFVDSDDTIEYNCLGQLINKAEKDDLDILCFGLLLVFSNCERNKFKIQYEENGKIHSGIDFICKVMMPPSACIAIYKRDFLKKNNLKFYEGILHEDMEFTPRAYCLANRISYIDRSFYLYNQREGSIMKSNRSIKRSRDLLTIADSLYSFTVNNLDDGTEAYKSMMKRVYFSFMQSLAFYSPEANHLSVYRERPYYPMNSSLFVGSMKYKIRLANISLLLYLWFYKLVKK